MNSRLEQEIIEEFGKKLNILRLQHDMSLRQLALEADLDHNYIFKLEQGKSNPSLTTILILAKALDIDPGQLLPKI